MIQILRRALQRGARKCKRLAPLPPPDASAEVELPRPILESLSKVIVRLRRCAPDQPERVLVKLPNAMPFHYSKDTALKSLAVIFPQPSLAQLGEAASLLRMVVNDDVRELRRAARPPNWATT